MAKINVTPTVFKLQQMFHKWKTLMNHWLFEKEERITMWLGGDKMQRHSA